MLAGMMRGADHDRPAGNVRREPRRSVPCPPVATEFVSLPLHFGRHALSLRRAWRTGKNVSFATRQDASPGAIGKGYVFAVPSPLDANANLRV